MTYVHKLVRPRAPTMGAPWMRVQVPPDQRFSMGTVVPPRGRLAMSADTFSCHCEGGECYWHQVCTDQEAANRPDSQEGARAKTYWTRDVTSARAEKPCSVCLSEFPVKSNPTCNTMPPRKWA